MASVRCEPQCVISCLCSSFASFPFLCVCGLSGLYQASAQLPWPCSMTYRPANIPQGAIFNITTAWLVQVSMGDAGSLVCMFKNCREQVVACVQDEQCKTALGALSACGLNDQVPCFILVCTLHSGKYLCSCLFFLSDSQLPLIFYRVQLFHVVSYS